ncbi:uncharacterized protein [Temnothorax longispinosus]|uniref:uncharacterized protein n=1 Tax=Temnothorax longispinosus TaxID=300112 RepID=UPI003A99D282
MKKGRYVDDFFGGEDTVQKASKVVEQVDKLCMAGGFPLKKWVSNEPEVISCIESDRKLDTSSVQIDESSMIHTLGLSWNPLIDQFKFTLNLEEPKVISKRTILSTISKIFDPLGFISPITITGRIITQELWSNLQVANVWINNHPSRWKEFVHNRVCFIQDTLPQCKWELVPGMENPADLATRVSDINCEKYFWVKTVQHYAFSTEFKIISQGQSLPKSNSLIRLTPYIDSEGLLRVGGRLHNSLLAADAKHPLILPKDSSFTTLHGGTQVTLSYIRETYWIIRGREVVKSFILRCIKCTRFRQQRAQQIMGQLPNLLLTVQLKRLSQLTDDLRPDEEFVKP